MLSGPLTMCRALSRAARTPSTWCASTCCRGRCVAKRLRPGVRFVYDSNEEYDSFMLIKDWLPRPVRRPLQRPGPCLEPWLARQLDATTTALPATHETVHRRRA